MSKYFNNKFFLAFLIIPFFNPSSLQYIPNTLQLYNVVQLWKLIVILLIILAYLLRRRLSTIVGLIILFECYAIGISWINGIFDIKVITNALIAIAISMLTELAIKNNLELFLKTICSILIILVVINFSLSLKFPNGLSSATLYTNLQNPIYFLSIDNGMIKTLLPPLILSTLLFFQVKQKKIYKRYKVWIILLNIISFITLLIVGSSTGIVVYLVFISTLLLYTYVMKRKYPMKFILVIYLSFFAWVVIGGARLKIIDTAAGLFGKTGTFTGRTTLWINSIQKIIERPFLGYGYTSGIIDIWGGNFSSHNLLLELVIQGGIGLGVLFLFLTIYAIQRLKYASLDDFNIIAVGIFAFLLVGLFEVGISEMYFVLLVLASHVYSQEETKYLQVQ